MVKINNTDDAISALQAIYGDMRTARASHNIYAYRIDSADDSDDNTTEHYEDDGEYGAGRKLLDLMKNKQMIVNQLVVVSRWSGSKRLGPSRFMRFDHILEAAANVIGQLV